MRKQDKTVVWPVYFDSTKTREEGRRVPKNAAVPTPRLEEVEKAAARLGFRSETVPDAGYPKTPWRKTGALLVVKKGSKQQMLKRIGRELSTLRMQAQKKD